MRTNPFFSIAGAYEWDETILDGITLPTAPTVEYEGMVMADYPVLNHDDLVWRILHDCGELELLYLDMDFLRADIIAWGRQKAPIWQKLYNTICLKYNPIWNKDGWIDRNQSGHHSRATYGSENTTSSGSSSLTHDVAGFNSETYVHGYRDTGSSSGSEGTTRNGTDNGNTSGSETVYERGNIGVTMTQTMLDSERQTALYDLYEVITNAFKKEFCIMVY